MLSLSHGVLLLEELLEMSIPTSIASSASPNTNRTSGQEQFEPAHSPVQSGSPSTSRSGRTKNPLAPINRLSMSRVADPPSSATPDATLSRSATNLEASGTRVMSPATSSEASGTVMKIPAPYEMAPEALEQWFHTGEYVVGGGSDSICSVFLHVIMNNFDKIGPQQDE
ncbi:hypothetical protein DFH06DRAFT_1122801 [Mycena polygramma]|nr:hypothetical protein DFH06DRAFT_1122801 [Mycena polygramma]